MFEIKLMLKDSPIMEIKENGSCRVLDFERLPFALRRENISYIDFAEWAANRTLPMGRSHAKEILNALRLPQNNRYAVCKTVRGLTLNDAYWICGDHDTGTWDSVNLYHSPMMPFLTEVSLSGSIERHFGEAKKWNRETIHTPEITTMGVSAKGWIRQDGEIFLHKIGKHEIPAHEILTALGIRHISYQLSEAAQISDYLSEERYQWIEGMGEKIVHSKLFTSEETGLVTFEEFQIFCESHGQNAYEEAVKIDTEAYMEMQIADYILNNNDRHAQNWGFLMDNNSARITGFCPLFDHDHAFSDSRNVLSQTTRTNMALEESARLAWQKMKSDKSERLDFHSLSDMSKPSLLTDNQWQGVLDRADALRRASA